MTPRRCRADEPTSGLDARAAQIVMRVVRNIVNNNRTIVCTIHQPSTEIFLNFDELLLLKRGGWTIYYGPLGDNSKDLVQYFESVNGAKHLQQGYNPATYMLEVGVPYAVHVIMFVCLKVLTCLRCRSFTRHSASA